MLFTDTARGDSYRGLLISIIIGIAFYFAVFGAGILAPSNIGWISNGDPAQAYLGWDFFRNSAWSFPVVGLSPHFGMEVSSSIVFTDSNPLLAIFFKIFSPLLPSVFQYFGIWLLICSVLQSIFAWKIVNYYSQSSLIKVMGTLLLMFIPAWINRVVHLNLMANFLILAAIFICLDDKKRARPVFWGLLIGISMVTHLYITFMICILWGGALLERVVQCQKNIKRIIFGEVLPILILMLTIGWVIGYFSVKNGAELGGFGDYGANLFAPLLANGWSLFIHTHLYTPGGEEGFNYLGLGIILLAVFNINNVFKYFSGKKYQSKIFIIVPVVIFIIYSLSNKIGVGPYYVSYPLPSFVSKFCSVFRASGRLLWPVTYLFVVFLISLTVKNNKPLIALAILSICVILQIGDTYNGWHAIHKRFSNTLNSDWTPDLKSQFWKDSAENYQHIRWVPFTNQSKYWKQLSYYATTAHKSTDAIYMARYDTHKAGKLRNKVNSSLIEGSYSADTIYVMENNLQDNIIVRPGDLYAKVDGVYILAPNMNECEGCKKIVTNTKFKKSLDFTHFGHDSMRLFEGWSTQEDWGVWSDGFHSSLMLPVSNEIHHVKIFFNAYISSKSTKQHIIVSVHGVKLGTFTVSESLNNTISIAIPTELIKDKKNILIEFEFPDATSPSSEGSSADSRLLAIGIKNIYME